MIGPYLTDEVDIITVTHDENGVETRVMRAGVEARVAERHKLVLNARGEEVLGSMQVLLSSDVAIDYDALVIVKKLAGVAYALPSKEWQVKSISSGHGLSGAMLREVWV